VRWLWIDRVAEFVPGRRIVAIKHVSMAEEYLRDHFGPDEAGGPGPVMPASLIIEGIAQAGGILVGHAEGFREKVVLAKISRASIEADAPPGATLRYSVEMTSLGSSGAATKTQVELAFPGLSNGETFRRVGSVDLVFSHLDRNIAGTDYPEHNFVFGPAFRTLLDSSGLSHVSGG